MLTQEEYFVYKDVKPRHRPPLPTRK